ncbi:MAG: hypothetical protein U5J62_09710 [Desulfurivibrio sp.]|nr:hypothetical protein [Desulfurivibrio sp.]
MKNSETGEFHWRQTDDFSFAASRTTLLERDEDRFRRIRQYLASSD